MDDACAGWTVVGGLVAIAAGRLLLQTTDPFLATLWGVAFVIGGAVAALVGAGVLLRLWR